MARPGAPYGYDFTGDRSQETGVRSMVTSLGWRGFISEPSGAESPAALQAARSLLTPVFFYSYLSTSAGAIRVAFRAGYSVARKLTKIATAAIQMPSIQRGMNGT